MRFELQPYVRVGPIEFGDTQSDVLRKLGRPDEMFHRGAPEGEYTISYRDFSVFVVLSEKNGVVLAAEFYDRADLLIEGHEILKMGNARAVTLLRELDDGVTVDHENHLVSGKYGVIMPINEQHEFNDDRTEYIGVFSSGYH